MVFALWSASVGCGWHAHGIPLEETKVLSVRMVRGQRPVERVERFTLEPAEGPRWRVAVRGLSVSRCRSWRVKKVQHVATLYYQRRHVPAKAWGWVSVVAGAALTAAGIGLMATNSHGFSGEMDSVDARAQQARFIGGLWLFLPGLGLGATGATWLALKREKVVVTESPPRMVREEQPLEDCGTEPLSGRKFFVGLPGLEARVSTTVSDSGGRAVVDLARLFFSVPMAVAPRALVVGTAHEGRRVDLPAGLYARASGLLTGEDRDVTPGKMDWDVTLGGRDKPVVYRVVLSCDQYLTLSVKVARRDERKGTRAGRTRRPGARGRGRRARPAEPRPAAAPAPKLGLRLISKTAPEVHGEPPVSARFVCDPNTSPELRLLAETDSTVTLRISVRAEPSRVSGRILVAKDTTLLLDKGRAAGVIPGREGVVVVGGQVVGRFHVLEARRDRAAAKLDGALAQDVAGRTGLRYRLEP